MEIESRRGKGRIAWNGYRTIVEDLQQEIGSGRLGQGSLLPTERELCERFSASRPTIRKALDELVVRGWAYRLKNRGVAAGTGVVTGTGNTIAWIYPAVPGLAVPTQALLRAGKHSERQIVDFTRPTLQSLEDGLQRAIDEDCAGAIVWNHCGFPNAVRLEHFQKRLAIVALEHEIGDATLDRVTSDHFQAGQLVTEALIARGSRNIACTSRQDMLESGFHRFRGYLSGLYAGGYAPNPSNFLPCISGRHLPADTRLLEYRFSGKDRPDAIAILDSECVDPVLECLDRLGLLVGREVDIAVIGDDSTAERVPWGTPIAKTDLEEMARAAIAVLEERIESPARPRRRETFPYWLVDPGE